MALKAKIKDKIRDWGATIAGIVVAVASAWSTIEWSTFDIKRDYMKLIVSAAIAIGGIFSKFKQVTPKNDTTTEG